MWNGYFRPEYLNTNAEVKVEDVVKTLRNSLKVIEASKDLSKIAGLEKRRQACSNPELDPESAIYKEKETVR